MNPFLIIMLILLVVSGLGLIVFILLHSGKGTGISDMIASSVYSTQTGTSIVEKNLDRITIIFAVVFLVSLIVLMIIYPQRQRSRQTISEANWRGLAPEGPAGGKVRVGRNFSKPPDVAW